MKVVISSHCARASGAHSAQPSGNARPVASVKAAEVLAARTVGARTRWVQLVLLHRIMCEYVGSSTASRLRPKKRCQRSLSRAAPAETSECARANSRGRMADDGSAAQNRRTLSSLKMPYPANSSSAPSPVRTTFIPSSCTSPERRNNGAGAVRSNGDSQCHTTAPRVSRISASPQTISWCSVPSRSAMRRWPTPSSNRASAKRTANVSSGLLSTSRTSDAITEESRPPLRYAPTGTSARSRSRTDCSSRLPSSSAASSTVRRDAVGSSPKFGCQYRVSCRCRSWSMRRLVPGCTLCTPANIVRGAAADQRVKVSTTAAGSITGANARLASSALISEPNTTPVGVAARCIGRIPRRSRTSQSASMRRSHSANANCPLRSFQAPSPCCS